MAILVGAGWIALLMNSPYVLFTDSITVGLNASVIILTRNDYMVVMRKHYVVTPSDMLEALDRTAQFSAMDANRNAMTS